MAGTAGGQSGQNAIEMRPELVEVWAEYQINPALASASSATARFRALKNLTTQLSFRGVLQLFAPAGLLTVPLLARCDTGQSELNSF